MRSILRDIAEIMAAEPKLHTYFGVSGNIRNRDNAHDRAKIYNYKKEIFITKDANDC